jgi:hypothetical protein
LLGFGRPGESGRRRTSSYLLPSQGSVPRCNGTQTRCGGLRD